MPIWRYAVGRKTPGAKSILVTVHLGDERGLEPQLELGATPTYSVSGGGR
jgi:hypothetical protein